MTNRTIFGRIHGRAIEFEEDLELQDGQLVEVTLREIPAATDEDAGKGLLRTEGALANDDSWDAIMEEVRRSRKLERRSDP